ncbi:MAG: hypothetical protein SO253_01565 [Bacilli bacterium]|nr:hypothetical protein [Bacilli bacterium]
MPYTDSNGRLRTSEEDILVPALRIIQAHPNCTMRDIKQQISKNMKFYPADLEPSPTRRGECKYHQIIGNLISHRGNNLFGKYVTVIVTSRRNGNQFVLNAEGNQFLNGLDVESIYETIDEYAENEYVQNAESYDDTVDLSSQNNRKPELGGGVKNNRYKTNSKLAKTVLKRCNYKCEYAKLINTEHPTFTTKANLPYLEAHHLIPMKAQKDFGNLNLDRVENIVGLCPLCHSIVHYGSFGEKERILKELYNDRIKALNNCDQPIHITFEELINKYYQ